MYGYSHSSQILPSFFILCTQNFDHYLVYWIAPTVGAVLATVLFAVFQASFLDDGEKKSKSD